MLSIGKLTGPGSERYYVDSVANGREDYYAGKGEMPGWWTGSATDLLMESDGPVSGEQLGTLLQGRSPASGEELGAASTRSVSGFDLTFRAPKSVSLVVGIGDPDAAQTARRAHDEAVAEALGYMEREACWTRRGRAGREHIRGAGFVAAGFRHRTSRAGDPALHTHMVIANVTRGTDGRWSALDGRQLYRHAKTAGYLYQAALRANLTRELGVEWEVVHHGTADILGVPRPVIEHFSRRRAEILEHMAERGEHSARAAQIATLATRRAKTHDVPVDRLRADWQARAQEHGFGPAELRELLVRSEQFPADRLQAARAAVDTPLPEVTEQASSFDRRAVLQAWAERHRHGSDIANIEAETDAWLGSSQATPLERQPRAPYQRRYSTPEMLRIEETLVQQAHDRLGGGVAAVDPLTLDHVLAQRPDLGDEQADMVRRLTQSGDGVQVVRSAAGTGKTYALDAARQAWEQDGRAVFGCALSARAAVELRDHTGIPATTIARLQLDIQHGYGLQSGSVLIVDEAGMVGTRALADLSDHAAQVNAKLVLTGDDRQLPEIDAGGAFRGIAHRVGAIELREVRRQRHDWDRVALNALREGHVHEWADAYREHERLVTGTDAPDTRARLIEDWHRAQQEHPGQDCLILAHRRDDVRDLNERARARLRHAGQLGDIEIQTAGRAFAAGDRVVAGRNDRTLDITNGQRGTVTTIDPQHRTITMTLDDTTERTLPASYLEEGHLDHGYAMTAHRAQGATVDRTFVLGSDELYREWGYTALSRHREAAHFYVNLGDDAQRELPGLELHTDQPLADPVTGPLARRRSKQLAIDIRDAHDETNPTPADARSPAQIPDDALSLDFADPPVADGPALDLDLDLDL